MLPRALSLSLLSLLFACHGSSSTATPPQKPKKAEVTPKPGELSEAEASSLFSRLPPLPNILRPEKPSLKLPPKSTPRPESTIKPLALTVPEINGTPSSAPAKPTVAPKPLDVSRISPEGDVGYTSEVSVSFSQPMVPLGSPGDAAKYIPVNISPTVKGHWYWKGTDLLTFESEGRFPMASTFTVSIPAGTKSDSGTSLANPVSATFSTSAPRLVNQFPTSSYYYDYVGPNETIFLVFDQKINAADILKKVEVSANKKTYKVQPVEQSKALLHKRFGSSVTTTDKDTWLALSVVGGLPLDSEISVTLPVGLPSAEGPLLTTSPQSFYFRTYGPLLVDNTQCGYSEGGNPCYAWDTVSFNFSNALDKSAFSNSQVTVTPTPNNLKMEPSGNAILITGDFETKKKYQFTVSSGIKDEYGQTLAKPSSKSFTFSAYEDNTPSISSVGGSFMVLVSNEDAFLPLYVEKLKSVQVKAYQVAPSQWGDYAQYLDDKEKKRPATPPGKLVLNKSFTTTLDKDGYANTLDIPLIDYLPKNKGNIFIEATGTPSKDLQPFYGWVQYTDLSIDTYVDNSTIYAVVSNLRTGAPIAGAEVVLFPDGKTVTTDSDGLVKLPVTAKGSQMIIAKTKDDTAFLPAKFTGDYSGYYYYSYDEASEETNTKPKPFDKNTLYGWKDESTPNKAHWYAVSDRKLYQPGEEAQIKGWLRELSHGINGDVLLSKTKEVQYTATDNRGQTLSSGSLPVTKLGGFTTTIKLPKEVPIGTVTVSFTAKGFTEDADVYLDVREFRRPEFEVKATAPNGPLFFGDEAIASVNGSYFAGGPLPNAETRWNINYSFTRYTPPNRSEFYFGYSDYSYWQSSPSPFSLTETTNQDGTHILRTPMPSPKYLAPYVADAAARVQDKNRQEWSSGASWIVHPAEVYLGAKTDKYYYFGKDPIKVDLITVDLDGIAVPGRPIDIKLEQYEQTPITRVETGKILSTQTCTQTSAQTASSCTFENKGQSRYLLTASSSDAKGRPVLTQFSIYVFDGEGWSYSEGEQKPSLQLLAEKKNYKPGETANLLLLAPTLPAEVTLTANREGYSLVKHLKLTETSTKLQIPITEAHVGGLQIEVHATQSTSEPVHDLPETESASVRLEVSSEVRRLQVSVTPNAQSAKPGEEVSLNVALKDYYGKPAANAEVAVIVVDEAILALADNYRLPDPLPPFYPNRYTIQELSSIRYYATMIAHGMLGYSRGGSGAGMGGGGAAGGIGGYSSVSVRDDYRPLAYFADALITNDKGEVSARFKLPGNLTRYRVMVVAADEKRFGGAEATITASLPLMVRPSPPRFLRIRDTFEVPVLLQNSTDKEVEVQVAARAAGLVLDGPKGYRVKVPARDRVEVRFPGHTESPGEAYLQIISMSDRNADASAVTVPIYSPSSTEAFATYGVLDGNDVFTQSIKPPKNAIPEYGGVSLTVSSTALSELSDAILYLSSYPYECSEQLSSKIVAVSSLRDVLAAFAAKSLPPPKDLEEAVQRDIKKLVARQDSDGHFGLWKKSDVSWPFLDVYVTFALVSAKDAGFTVPEEALTKALSNLKALKLNKTQYKTAATNTLNAYALYVRGLAKEDVSKDVIALASVAKDTELSTESVALFLASLKDSSDPQVKRLQKLLYNRSSETAETAQITSDAYMENDSLVLSSSGRTNALGLLALLSSDPKDELVVKLTKGILAQRKTGRWMSTQENAWVLYALGQYFKKLEGTPPEFTMRLWLGDDFAGEAKFSGYNSEKQRVEIPLAQVKDEKALTLSKEGTGRLYYRMGVSYLLPEEALPAADYGFEVSRVYESLDAPNDVTFKNGVWYIRAGARIQVRVTMRASGTRYHVALVDPLPAGLEAQDPTIGYKLPRNVPRVWSSYGGWGWEGGNWFLHRAFRSERVESSAPYVIGGEHVLEYTALATTPGVFIAPPAYAEEMYAPETFGRSEGAKVVIK